MVFLSSIEFRLVCVKNACFDKEFRSFFDNL